MNPPGWRIDFYDICGDDRVGGVVCEKAEVVYSNGSYGDKSLCPHIF
jgi:hypothetical protein